jgi:hypothetical protein
VWNGRLAGFDCCPLSIKVSDLLATDSGLYVCESDKFCHQLTDAHTTFGRAHRERIRRRGIYFDRT